MFQLSGSFELLCDKHYGEKCNSIELEQVQKRQPQKWPQSFTSRLKWNPGFFLWMSQTFM